MAANSSLSQLDSATLFCFFARQLRTPPPRVTTPPLVDLREVLSEALSASTTKPMLFPAPPTTGRNRFSSAALGAPRGGSAALGPRNRQRPSSSPDRRVAQLAPCDTTKGRGSRRSNSRVASLIGTATTRRPSGCPRIRRVGEHIQDLGWSPATTRLVTSKHALAKDSAEKNELAKRKNLRQVAAGSRSERCAVF